MRRLGQRKRNLRFTYGYKHLRINVFIEKKKCSQIYTVLSKRPPKHEIGYLVVGASMLVPVAMTTFGTVLPGIGTIHVAGGVAATLQSNAEFKPPILRPWLLEQPVYYRFDVRVSCLNTMDIS